MSSNKEEDDKAWWSDYQASTKLKRKWNKEKKNDHDDLDDILGDLDDIVNKPEVKVKVSKEKKCDSDDLDDILGDLDDIVNSPDVKVQVSKDVHHSKAITVDDRGKSKSEEDNESDVDNKSFKEEKLFEIGGTYKEKNLDRVETVNKNIEKEIKGEVQKELEVKHKCIQEDVVIKGKQENDEDRELEEASEGGITSCAASSSLSGRPHISSSINQINL